MLAPLSTWEFAHSTLVQALMDYERPILKRCDSISSQAELASTPHPSKLKCAEVMGWCLVKVRVERVGKSFRFGPTVRSRSEAEEAR